jgi:4-amino-4-deoxy-L-arabinose transferase-like glycosyltransferase
MPFENFTTANKDVGRPMPDTKRCDPGCSTAMPFWVGLLAAVVLAAGVLGREVWTPDEPREAALALAMSRTGQWVIPELAGQPFVEKPPLYYAVGAAFIRVLGDAFGPTAALRIAGILWGLGTLAAVYLLAARLLNRTRALAVMCLLATMPGFIQVSHWLIVDQALVCFVAASLWLLAEAYRAERPWALPAAAAAAAGAFLVKGGVGPAVIGLGWLGLVIPMLAGDRPGSCRHSFGTWALAHALAALVFLVLVGAWLVPFRAQAGPDLFHEWFWRNHAGRFLGQTPDLGHQNGPLYYLGVIPLYVLPWLPVFLAGLWAALRECRAGGWRRAERLLPLVWGLGGLLLLTASGTKREIYLAVLLPAFALLAETGWRRAGESGWVRLWSRAWVVLCLAALAALAFGILSARFWAGPAVALGVLDYWPALVLVCGLGLILGIAAVRARGLSQLARQSALTALLAIVGLQAGAGVGNAVKDYGPAFREFHREMARRPGLRPAAWGLDETSRAGLYYFGGDAAWPALTDSAEVRAVLEGRHPRYNAVIAYRKTGKTEPVETLAPAGAEILAVRRMGRDRELRLAVPPAVPQTQKEP